MPSTGRFSSRSDAEFWLSLDEFLPLAGGKNVRLTRGNDVHYVADTGEHVFALAGNDFVRGGAGDDIIQGGAGDDAIGGDNRSRSRDTLYGGAGEDSVSGGAGNDHIFGGSGNDALYGDGGADVIEGGAGQDTIFLGMARHGQGTDGKRDIVVYTSVSDSVIGGGDNLQDFRAGEDRIDLSRIDANAMTPGDDAFHFIGNRAFSGTPGELRIGFDSVFADIDGDGQADFQITLTGASNLQAHRDFIL